MTEQRWPRARVSEGVYCSATWLSSGLVRRWPEEYAKRAEEMQAKEARLRAILARQRAQEKQQHSIRPAF